MKHHRQQEQRKKQNAEIEIPDFLYDDKTDL
jgi:hypothetical protein